MEVLIVTGRFGMGHYTVSQSIAEQINQTLPQANVKIVDLCESILPEQANLIYRTFEKIVNRSALLFNLGYKYTERFEPNVRPLLPRSFMSRLKALLLYYQPDAIICTVPIAPALIADCLKELGLTVPFMTCITDLICHPYWLHPDTKRYFVADYATEERLMSRGVPEEKIVVHGMPVKRAFDNPPERPCHDKREKHLLIMGGGLGLLSMPKSFYQAINRLPDVKTTIITGNNKRLLKKLSGRYENIEVLGYTDKVAQYMRQSDLIISKAGGITVFESIYSELPMLLTEPMLAQELGNAEFVVQQGVGRLLEKRTKDRIREIEELIYDDTALWNLRQRMRTIQATHDKMAVGRLLAEVCR
ncbi:MAG TPA: UDP-diphospho-muramoylpentapeptide beta-N-acetylglucosaminyltransferase [Clostridiales bacterium]|jgi:processive 1,2-diacylglycerol beta-glucosyltransferase|nr:UDP-diphospho-muramoylpentapeptide beta-N-acetylglucosaminyltransferase [Clostridiales bacterium]